MKPRIKFIRTIYFVNKKVLFRSVMKTYKLWLVNGAVFALVMAIFYVDTFSGVAFLPLVLKGIIHAIWIVGLYLLVNFVFNKSAFKTIFELYRGKKSQ